MNIRVLKTLLNCTHVYREANRCIGGYSSFRSPYFV